MVWVALEAIFTAIATLVALSLGVLGIIENNKRRNEQLILLNRAQKLSILQEVLDWARALNNTAIEYSREAIERSDKQTFNSSNENLCYQIMHDLCYEMSTLHTKVVSLIESVSEEQVQQ